MGTFRFVVIPMMMGLSLTLIIRIMHCAWHNASHAVHYHMTTPTSFWVAAMIMSVCSSLLFAITLTHWLHYIKEHRA